MQLIGQTHSHYLYRTKGQFSRSRKQRREEKKRVRKINKHTQTLLLSCCSVGVDGAASGQNGNKKLDKKKWSSHSASSALLSTERNYSSVMQTWHQELPSTTPHLHTHTHIPLFSASSLFLPKPTRPLRPQGQLVWHGIPSPPHLHLFIFSSLTSTQKKQSLTYLAPYLFPLQLMSQPLTSSWCRNNSNKKTSP